MATAYQTLREGVVFFEEEWMLPRFPKVLLL